MKRLLAVINQLFAGPGVKPEFRPKGWEIPPRMPGDSNIIMTRGEKDGPHTTVRLLESTGGGIENKG